MIEKQKLELIKIPMSRLLKLELPRFALRLIEIVERHDPEELKIKEIYDLLDGEKSNISKLAVKYGPHPLTLKLSKLRELRSLYVGSIDQHLKIVSKKNVASETVLLVQIEINRFLGNLRESKNDETVSQKITLFLEQVNTNPVLQTALESFQFMEHIDNLTSVHNSIQEAIYDRLDSKSGRPKATTKELVKSVLTATNDMIIQIQIAPKKHPEVDYEPLYNKLNELLVEYRDLINRRVLFNKRNAETNNKNGETTEMTTPQQTEPAGRMMPENAKEVELDVLRIQQVEKEEAAAMLSKSKQLPLVNEDDEA